MVPDQRLLGLPIQQQVIYVALLVVAVAVMLGLVVWVMGPQPRGSTPSLPAWSSLSTPKRVVVVLFAIWVAVVIIF